MPAARLHCTYLFLLLILTSHSWSQNTIGLPEIVNYTKSAYKGGAQTRQMEQDGKGIMYFANDEGLLTFNGARWNIYPLPKKSLVRSIEFGSDQRLYTGGQDEIGYFYPAANGNLQYRSLKELIPAAARSFADVWEICISGGSVFFQTSKQIYRFTGQQVTVYDDPHWLFMGKTDHLLMAQSADKGLLVYRKGEWESLSGQIKSDLPATASVTSLTSIGQDSILMTTLKNGVYLYANRQIRKMRSALLDKIEGKNISSSRMVNDHQIAVGTNLDGCFVVNKKGELVTSFGKDEGLENNNILSIFLDHQKNLWLGLHNGLGFIPYNNAVKHIHPSYANDGAGFSSQVYNEKLYISTSSGVYSVPVGAQKHLENVKAYFTPIQNSEGEAWNLSEVNGRLLIGHNDGAFLVDGNKATPIDRSAGYWNFQSINPADPNSQMVAGTYNGLEFFHYNKGVFSRSAVANSESARFVVSGNNKIWFSHPYKGIYAATLNNTGGADIKKYTAAQGVKRENNNYLFRINGHLLLTSEDGVLEYDPAKDAFAPSAFYNKHLPKVPIRYLKDDADGNIWFVFEKKIAVLDVTTREPQVISFPELTNKFVAGFEHINPIDKNNVLIGGEKGFYHINYEAYKKLKTPLSVQISIVRSINSGDSLLYAGYGTERQEKPLKFSHDFNSLHFEFASPVYGQLSTIEYSYFLKGFDKDWIDYNTKTEKDYTNLPPGEYVFKVKARNNLGNESPVSEFTFYVSPPWYKTVWAYGFYVLLGIMAVYLLYRYQRKKLALQQKKHDLEQRKMKYLHQLELDKAEKELIQLRNEKLEAEISAKNNELASTAMHLVQKSDVIVKIREQVSKLKNTPVENAADLKQILKTLNQEDKIEDQWQQFSLHFDAVHHNYLAKLKKSFPHLSPNDHKLCAYLKMNLSTKEIAQLMNISVRGVEISRYRLRKKMQVPAGTHLFNFLDSLSNY